MPIKEQTVARSGDAAVALNWYIRRPNGGESLQPLYNLGNNARGAGRQGGLMPRFRHIGGKSGGGMNPRTSGPTDGGNPANTADRLHYLDWLRIVSILTVFLIHCAKIFDYHTTGVRNPEPSFFWSAFRDFNLVWIMPLFFVISGGATFFPLRNRRALPFVRSRVTRLLVPLLLVGTFVINPLYVYAQRLFQGMASGGFFAWYPHYFDGIYGFGGNFAPLGHGTHLWYLEYLFIFTLILLPWFMRSQKRLAGAGNTRPSRFERPWALLLLFLPISAAAGLFEIIGLGGIRITGGWDPVSYLLFFAYGWLIYSNPRIQETIRRYGFVFLAAAAALTWLFVDSHFGFNLVIPGVTRHDMAAGGGLLPLNHAGWAAVQAFRGLLGWCWILGLLGSAARLINIDSRVLSYGNPAVLPFYILHHPVILLAGCLVTGWSVGIGAKFTVIAAVSFAVIMALYDLLIKRVRPLRFLFGMRSG